MTKLAAVIALAAVTLTGCCGLHQIRTSDADGTFCAYIGIRCCPPPEEL